LNFHTPFGQPCNQIVTPDVRFTFSTTQQRDGDRGKAAEGCRRTRGVCLGLRIAQSVWSAPALAALSGGRRGWKDGCPPCGTKSGAEVTATSRRQRLRRRKSRRSASSGDDQISREASWSAPAPLALWGRTHFTLSTTSSSVKMNAGFAFHGWPGRGHGDCVRHARTKVWISQHNQKRQRPIEPPSKHPS